MNATCTLNSATTACEIAGSEAISLIVVVLGGVTGLLFGLVQYRKVAAISLPEAEEDTAGLIEEANRVLDDNTAPGVEANPLTIPAMGESGLQAASEVDSAPTSPEPAAAEDMRVKHEHFTELTKIYGVSSHGRWCFRSLD